MDTKDKSLIVDKNKDKLVNMPLIEGKQITLSELNQNMMVKFTQNFEELQKQEIKKILVNEFGNKTNFSDNFINKVFQKLNASVD